MEEIKTVIIKGFSLKEDYYTDSLSLARNGEINFYGKTLEGERSFHSKTTSEGYQLMFSTMCIELIEANKKQILKDTSYGGYTIELLSSYGEMYSYTFYGTMADNMHEKLRDSIVDFFPLYEELPEYLDSFKEELSDDMDFEDHLIN